MTVKELAAKAGFEEIFIADPSTNVDGAYAGDLLSWVMGNASEGNVFVTIMTNVNVMAVATLIEMSCVLFCENVEIPQDVIDTAMDKKVNLLRSPLPTYETCAALSKLLE